MIIARQLEVRVPFDIMELINQKRENSTTPFTSQELATCVDRQAQIKRHNATMHKKSNETKGTHKVNVNTKKGFIPKQFEQKYPEKEKQCLLCQKTNKHNENHSIWYCPQLKTVTPEERFKLLKAHGICFRCGKHELDLNKPCRFVPECRRKECGKNHQTMLHYEKVFKPVRQVNHVQGELSVAVSPTVKVRMGLEQMWETGFALMDTGASTSLISLNMAKKLRLTLKPPKTRIETADSQVLRASHQVTLQVKSLVNNYTLDVQAYVVKTPCGAIPGVIIPKTINKTDLANPDIEESVTPDLLLGADHCGFIIKGGKKRISPNLVTFETELGKIVMGRGDENDTERVLTIQENRQLEFIKSFYGVHAGVGYNEMPGDNEVNEVFTEDHFQANVKFENNQYTVSIPFKPGYKLGDTKRMAKKKLLNTLQRGHKAPEIWKAHVEQVNELIENGVMVPTKESAIKYFVPQHIVTKKDSLTTKHLLVSDFSAKSDNGRSCNDIQYTGKPLQQSIEDIMALSRVFPILIFSDITRMYTSIKLAKEDQAYQGVLWCEKPGDPIKCYKMTRVTFGSASAPYLALRVMQKIAEDNPDLPLAAKAVLNNMFVDDLVVGCHTIEEGQEIVRQLQVLMKRSGMKLRKWSSNVPKVLEAVPAEDKMTEIAAALDKSDMEFKTLGTGYNSVEDYYFFKIRKSESIITTMTEYCSHSHSIFDTLNLLSPIGMKLKNLMGKLFKAKTDWKDPLPEDIQKEWNNIAEQLPELEKLKIKRYIPVNETSEIHAASDASATGYGGVIYIKTIVDGEVEVNLIRSHGSVVPLSKDTTIPRSELNAAVSVSLLADRTNKLLGTKMPIYLYIDNQAVIGQIQKEPALNSTYISNRTKIVRNLVGAKNVFFINTKDNFAADMLSRGAMPVDFMKAEALQQWFHGMGFLKEKDLNHKYEVFNTQLEARKLKQHINVNTGVEEDHYVLTELMKGA